MAEPDDAGLANLAARIAAGESVDASMLPEGQAQSSEVRKLLRFSNVAERLLRNADSRSTPTEMPERIGAWRLVRLLGTGGMGDVWLGERADGTVEHRVAIKRVRGASPAFSARLEVERRILATLSHANIARFIDAGVDSFGSPWLAIEYIDGLTFGAWLKQQPRRWREVLAVLLDAAGPRHHVVVEQRADRGGERAVAGFGVQRAGIHEAVELGRLKIAMRTESLPYKDEPELCVQPGADSGVRLLDWVGESERLAGSSVEPGGQSLPDLVKQIRDLGRATTLLTGGIEKVLQSGSTDTKLTLSSEDRKALRQLLSAMNILSASQRSIAGTIRGYAEDRTEERWQTVKWLIKDIQDSLKRVQEQFHTSAWLFTIEEPELVSRVTVMLQQRFLVLDGLISSPAPSKSTDLKALCEIADIYQELIDQLQCHRKSLTGLLMRSSQ